MARESSDKIYRLEEIASATDNFSAENLITEGSLLGKVYKGQLLGDGNSMKITIRRLDCEYATGDELQKEILMLKRFKYKNIASMLGHCDENKDKIVIYEQASNGTLDRHLNDATLTWSKRLKICLGIARALNHIHYDVIHCDISSSKILLDNDWEPKIYGFELSTEYPTSWRHRLLFTRNMTPKYDVYCFGVLLFEILCGRKPIITNDGVLEEPDKFIDPSLRKQMDTESLVLFKKIFSRCLNQQSVERPTMDQIVKELDDVLDLQLKNANLKELPIAGDEGTSSKIQMVDNLAIPLSKIRQATNYFHQEHRIGCGGYGEVYKAKLEVCLSSVEEKCKVKPSKTRKTVAIKRLFSSGDEKAKEGFTTEIELLTSCKHPNIVSLLGFSKEDGEMILVYEYACRGSLSDYLGSDSKMEGKPNGRQTKENLTWAQRIQICLDVAHGIDYLHTNMEGKPRIIHRDIKSDNILLDKNLKAKVADFGLSKFTYMKQQVSTMRSKFIAGTEVYLDPEYMLTGKYKRASDIYSFGVVLFEVLSGRLAYDNIYLYENEKGLAPIARRRFTENTLKELMDPKMIEEDDHTFTFNREPNQRSFDIFSKIAYGCLAETQAKRPTTEVIIRELQNALKLQGETIVLQRFQLSDIMSATKDFDETYVIGLYTNGMVYRAESGHFGNNGSLLVKGKSNGESSKKHNMVAIKRFSGGNSRQAKQESFAELEILASYKHPGIVSLLGFCDEGDEMILVYEHDSNKSLDEYLKSVVNMKNLTWTHRLHMCLEIAHGLKHFHTNMAKHIDIKSANIVLDNNCQAKIAYFGISNLHSAKQEVGIKVYEAPEYETTGILETKSDIYSFGVVLFEIFCGRLAYDPDYIKENDKGLAPIARLCFKDGTIEGMMDPKLKVGNNEDFFASSRGPNRDSLDTFLKIAYDCLGEAADRPTMEHVIQELERALNFQVPM